MSLEPYKRVSGILIFGRLANVKSWVFMISRAASADEATSTGTLPRCNNMSGPCLRDKAWRVRWGLEPSWWRFPMIGSFRGEGGMFVLVLTLDEIHLFHLKNAKMMNEEKKMM